MRLRHSLRFRIIATFSLAGMLMGFLFGGIIFGFLHNIEDELFENQLRFETERFLEQFEASPTTPLPRTSTLQGYIGLQSVPEDLRDWARNLGPGLHESIFEDLHVSISKLPNTTELVDFVYEDFHVSISELPNTAELFYLVYKVEALEPLEAVSVTKMTLLAIFVATFFSGLFGYVIANRMISPVMRLSQMVSASQPEDTSLPLEGDFYDDEVGQLAHNFQDSLARVGAFVARERRFTRDASHEFRTPVTVIKGAAELLALHSGDEPSRKALSRIQRAVLDLENIIETFLYLGREDNQFDDKQRCELLPVVEEALEQNRYLLEGKDVTIRLSKGDPYEVFAPKPVVAIAVGNLIRNSFQYTETGQIHLELAPGSFKICDTGRGIAASDLQNIKKGDRRPTRGEGFGLGLSIVSDFCNRYGWQLEIQSELAKGTEVHLHFQPDGFQTST